MDTTSMIAIAGLVLMFMTFMVVILMKVSHLTLLVNSRVTELIVQTERAAELTGRLAGRLAERAEHMEEDRQDQQDRARQLP